MFARLVRFARAFFRALFRERPRPLPPPRRVEKRKAPTRKSKAAPARGSKTPASEHAPRADGTPDPGEVVWAWVPYEDDPQKGKDRPVLLIGRRGKKLLGVAFTSKPHARFTVEVGAGPWDREGRVSYAKVDHLIDLDLADVRREGAALDPRRFQRVLDAVEVYRAAMAARD